jgi:hypothetical protein
MAAPTQGAYMATTNSNRPDMFDHFMQIFGAIWGGHGAIWGDNHGAIWGGHGAIWGGHGAIWGGHGAIWGGHGAVLGTDNSAPVSTKR